ncbi:gliding motility-associated-like protein [Flavobacterium arsenatis]|uniref:Gliding motility-associated-like protein n=1 Tax=Flavobacterium arsenatis TaxID=1484332 RepID=A0ABU1TSW5_9FLAO|nr:T9SS type B sorting domain-containing protein [Flavobacterium arsenatis]MDR6968960.1 gliding motility-associated-like protein [Flavobacterium arsenatis]
MTKTFTLKYSTRILFLSLLFLAFGFKAQGQIYFHNFGTGNINSHPYNVAPTTLAPNLSNSSWTNTNGAWTDANGSTGNAITTTNGANTITLTFNVAANYQVSVTSFNFWRKRSNAGPQNWAMSINGIAVGNGTIPQTGAPVGSTNVTNVAGLTGTVTVTIALTGGGAGNFNLDDFELQGSVTQACTPPTILGHTPAMGPENTFITITGSGFLAGSGTSAVKLSGVNVASFTVISDTEITANIPAGNNLSGLISVTTNGCEGTGVMYFAVIESTGSSASNLYISELYDAQAGSGGVIELYNGTANPIDLSGYTIRRYADVGDTTPSYEIALSGIVPAGGIYLIGIGSPIPCGAVTGTNFATGFNDDDRLELVQNGSVIDTVETPNNTGFSMIRNPNAVAPKLVFNGSDWNSSNSENCSNVGSHTTTVIPAPAMPVVTIPATCENGQVSLSATLSNPAGFTYQWKVLDASNMWLDVTDTGSYSGSSTNTLTIDPVLLSFDNNQYFCVATSTSNTVVSNADLLEVIPSTTPVTNFSYPTQICTTSASVFPTPATGFTTGGTYSVNIAGLAINTTTGEINASTSTPNTYIITYTIASSGGCNLGGSSPFTVEIVNAITPVLGFSYPANICKNSTSVMPILSTGFTPGGTFSSDSGLVIDPLTGEINPSASTPLPHSVVYTVVANPATCLSPGLDTALVTFVTEVTPVVNFTYPVQVCTTSAPVSPTTASGFTPGGVFSSDPGLTINPSTGEVNIASSTVGPHTINYTVLADPSICQGGDSFAAPLEITNNITPITGFSYPSPVCVNSVPILPTPVAGFTPGGTYSANDPGLIINPNTGEINVVASTPASYIVTYTVTADPSICMGFGDDTFPVVIQSSITPVVGFTYPTNICKSSTSVMPILNPGFTPGGTFTSDSGLTINPTTGEINPSTSTAAPHSVFYTIVANPANCLLVGTDNTLVAFVAETTPVVSFSYPTQVCIASAPVSPTTATGFTTGGTFTSDPGLIINAATGEVNITSSTVGPHTITYSVLADPSICQGGNSFTAPLEITGSITPITAFSYPSPICESSSPIFPTPVAGFTTGGTYTSNNPGLIINPNTGEINVVASTPASYIVTYTVTADPSICRGFGDDIFPVVIQSLSTPVVSFTYATPVCPNDPPVNPTLATGFTTGGTFTSDPGLIINPTTGQINVVASTPGSHLVTYTLLQNNATCTAGGSDDFNFTIDATAAITPITGDDKLCVGETLQLSNATPGGTWSSSDESIATVDANGLVTGIVSNFVDIIYTLNSGCAPEAKTTLAVYAIPQPLLDDQYLCISNVSGLPLNSVRIECGVPNLNHTFVWTLDGNPLPTITNRHVATELGVYEVTVTNTISGCSNTTSCEVFASSTAEATATVGEDFSQNQTITVNVTGGSGVYLFQLNHGVPQESNVFPYAYQGEYTITVIDKNSCQDLEFTIFALNYPRFFTPNGDGYNDTWGIKGLTDLNAKTYIFDRFGKMVKFLNASGEEWDGTLNGNQLPSTDYWFLLEYKNRDGLDKEFKAHFSMKR